MSVIDTSVVVDFLLGVGAASTVEQLLAEPASPHGLAAPDVLVFEVLSALRGAARRGEVNVADARTALRARAKLSVALYPAMPLCDQAWALRHNIAAGDALFVSLALALGMPLVTKDRRLAQAARLHTDLDVIEVD